MVYMLFSVFTSADGIPFTQPLKLEILAQVLGQNNK